MEKYLWAIYFFILSSVFISLSSQRQHARCVEYLHQPCIYCQNWFWSLNLNQWAKWALKFESWPVVTCALLCTPLEVRGAKTLPIGNARGALVFLREFSVWILILHILKVTKGSYSSLQLLQVTTGYYRLEQATTGY